jgi:hypothetical protein
VSASTVTHAAGDIEALLLALGVLHTHFAGLQRGQHRRVTRRDADFAHLRRREHHRGHARMDFTLCGYDVDVDLSHDLVSVDYWNFFAFSTASSIVPTM